MVAVKRAFWPVEPVGFLHDLPMDVFLHSVESVDFHIHAAFELLLVVSGCIRLYVEPGEERHLSAGDVAIVHGWQPHATQALGAPNCVLALQFDPSTARHDPHFARRRFDLAAPGDGEVPAHLRALMARILLETRMKRAAWQMEVEALLLQLMSFLVRKLPHRLEPPTADAASPFDERRLSVHLQNAATFIRRNSAEPLRLDQVAAANGISAGYLSRLFRNETGGSFGSFVTQVRLLRSLDLLAAPHPKKMLSVALECGFPNVKSFNLAFRRSFGCVPTEWRRRRQAGPQLAHPYQRLDEPAAIAALQAWAGL